MRSRTFLLAPIAGLLLIFAVTAGFGQDLPAGGTKPQPTPTPGAGTTAPGRPNLMAQLNLTPEQMQQIRRLNTERKPLMEAAQTRLRAASRALDEAIYSEQTNDADFEAKIREVQAAQSEVTHIRSTNEFAVRKVLTPEQLVRFRDLRSRFEEFRQTMEKRRKGRMMPGQNGLQPNRRNVPQSRPPQTQ